MKQKINVPFQCDDAVLRFNVDPVGYSALHKLELDRREISRDISFGRLASAETLINRYTEELIKVLGDRRIKKMRKFKETLPLSAWTIYL